MNAPHAQLSSPEQDEAAEARRRDLILRYSAGVRTRHWLVVISFFLAALSGFALFHPALFGLSSLFGGGPWTRILHPYLGLLMVLVFLLLAGAVAAENRMQPRDWAWLRQYRDVVNNREDRLPEVGRYNAGQKLVFYLITVTPGWAWKHHRAWFRETMTHAANSRPRAD
jgi:formate dehydrogenase subunit gamma